MADGRYVRLQTPKIMPSPEDFDEAITAQDAKECGMIVDTEFYPHKALTGRKVPIEGCWSRHTYDEFVYCYTDIEAGLRAALEDAHKLLAEFYGSRQSVTENIEKTQKFITESLEKFKRLPK